MKRPRRINMCPGCGFDFGHCTDVEDLHIRASTRLVANLVETQAIGGNGDKWSEALEGESEQQPRHFFLFERV